MLLIFLPLKRLLLMQLIKAKNVKMALISMNCAAANVRSSKNRGRLSSECYTANDHAHGTKVTAHEVSRPFAKPSHDRLRPEDLPAASYFT